MDSGNQLYDRLTSDQVPQSLQKPLRVALEAIQAALRQYGPEALVASFNGGKDATVVYHLCRAVFSHSVPGQRLKCVYWSESNAFPEIDALVSECEKLYEDTTELIRYNCSFTDGLVHLVNDKGIRGVFLGTRRGDPNGVHAETFEPSSPSWPCFMRINPILTWTYHDVWKFLRHFDLTYCSLYDEGYTSLGNVSDTLKNPQLRNPDGTYRPAYQLADESEERLGRVKKSKAAAATDTNDSITIALVVVTRTSPQGANMKESLGVVEAAAETIGARGGILSPIVIVNGSSSVGVEVQQLAGKARFVFVVPMDSESRPFVESPAQSSFDTEAWATRCGDLLQKTLQAVRGVTHGEPVITAQQGYACAQLDNIFLFPGHGEGFAAEVKRIIDQHSAQTSTANRSDSSTS